MSVTGDFSKLSKLQQALKRVPTVVAQKVAAKVSPALTSMARASFKAGDTVYGDPRPSGSMGNDLDLFETGATFNSIGFKAVGTRTRCVLGTSYAKYLIRYGLLPHRNAVLPVEWSKLIRETANATIAAELAQ